MLKDLEKKQKKFKKDTNTLKNITGKAQRAQGQLEAIGYANQLANQQAAQLMKIQKIMLEQHSMLLIKASEEQDQAARDLAKEKLMTQGKYYMPPPKTFYF